MTLILIRGLPGSGKSTKAKELLDVGFVNDWFEADMFFMDINGEYRFDRDKIKDAHKWCQQMTKRSLKSGRSVVISNTFTRIWEMEAYIEVARFAKADVIVIECKGEYQNIHDVPEESLALMKERWEPLLKKSFTPFNVDEAGRVYLEETLGIPVNTVYKLVA